MVGFGGKRTTTVEIEEAVEERFGAIDITFVDGYRQIDVARLWHCSRSAVAQRFKK